MKPAEIHLVSEETKLKIIDAWKFNKLNSIPQIAIDFELKTYVVNDIINEYLSLKTKK